MKFRADLVGRCDCAKTRRTDENVVRERSRGGLALRVNAMTNRAALHEDDRVMSILASNRRGQTGHELRFGSAGDQLKASGARWWHSSTIRWP